MNSIVGRKFYKKKNLKNRILLSNYQIEICQTSSIKNSLDKKKKSANKIKGEKEKDKLSPSINIKEEDNEKSFFTLQYRNIPGQLEAELLGKVLSIFVFTFSKNLPALNIFVSSAKSQEALMLTK